MINFTKQLMTKCSEPTGRMEQADRRSVERGQKDHWLFSSLFQDRDNCNNYSPRFWRISCPVSPDQLISVLSFSQSVAKYQFLAECCFLNSDSQSLTGFGWVGWAWFCISKNNSSNSFVFILTFSLMMHRHSLLTNNIHKFLNLKETDKRFINILWLT